jgi:hypothetical protein
LSCCGVGHPPVYVHQHAHVLHICKLPNTDLFIRPACARHIRAAQWSEVCMLQTCSFTLVNLQSPIWRRNHVACCFQ